MRARSLSLPLLLALTPHPTPSREVRWYTSGGSRGQFDEERAHATGLFSCCTGFAIYPNASFRCPDADFWAKTTAPFISNYTVDHTISVCRGCDAPGGAKRLPFNWSAAQASIPAMVECADAGNITGFLIDWEPPSHRVRPDPVLPLPLPLPSRHPHPEARAEGFGLCCRMGGRQRCSTPQP